MERKTIPCVLKLLATIAAIALVSASCQNAFSSSGGAGPAATGSLLVSVIGPAGAAKDAGGADKTIVCADASVSTYQASGTGPSGASFGPTVSSSGSFSFGALAAGSWKIAVKGLDAAGATVVEGSAAIEVAAGETASAAIVLVPSGSGALSLSASWPSGLSFDEVGARLTSASGKVTSLPLAISGSSASLSDAALAGGSYVLVLSFLNKGVVVASPRTESVVIYGGKKASASFSLTMADFAPRTVSYDANGADSGTVPPSEPYAPGATAAVAGNPGALAKSGRIFTGWNTAADGSGASYAAGNAFPIGLEDRRLYAVWISSDAIRFVGTTIFQGSTKPTGTLIIPPGTTAVGNSAFEGCDGLSSVVFPSTVASIDQWGFYESGLASVDIPEGMTSIGIEAFYGCAGLKRVRIPAGTTDVMEAAFGSCPNLEAIDVDPANPNYASVEGALYTKDLTLLFTVPGAKSGIFAIPPSVVQVYRGAIKNCARVTRVDVPPSVATIANAVFQGDTALASIIVDSGNAAYMSADGVLFTKDGGTLICMPSGKTGSYAMPEGVRYVWDEAFGDSGLSSVALPSTLTSIGQRTFHDSRISSIDLGSGLKSIGILAFYNCDLLSSIDIPSNVTGINSNAFLECGLLSSVTMRRATPPGLGMQVFYNCAADLAIHVPDSAAVTAYQSASNWNTYASRIVTP